MEASVLDWFEAWAADARRRDFAERYINQQRSRVTHLQEFLELRATLGTGDARGMGDATRPTITPDDLRAWLAHLADQGMIRPKGGRRAPCSGKTLNNHLSALRKFFDWCVKSKYLRDNPAEDLEWSKQEERAVRAFTTEQVWGLVQAAEADEQAEEPECCHPDGRVIVRSPLYRVLIATGIRIGAAKGLTVGDFALVDSPPKVIVPASLDKSRREREIVISDLDRAYFARVFEGMDPASPAFDSPSYRTLQRDMKVAGVPGRDRTGKSVGFHGFRRWHGTEMDRQDFSLKQIQQRLGHASILTTQRYVVREAEEQQRVAHRLSQSQEDFLRKKVDRGAEIADDVPVEAAPHLQPLKNMGTGPRRAASTTDWRGPPLAFSVHSAGSSPASREQVGHEQAPAIPGRLTGSSPVARTQDHASDRIRLLRALLDLLDDGGPPAQAEVHDDRVHPQQRPDSGSGPARKGEG